MLHQGREDAVRRVPRHQRAEAQPARVELPVVGPGLDQVRVQPALRVAPEREAPAVERVVVERPVEDVEGVADLLRPGDRRLTAGTPVAAGRVQDRRVAMGGERLRCMDLEPAVLASAAAVEERHDRPAPLRRRAVGQPEVGVDRDGAPVLVRRAHRHHVRLDLLRSRRRAEHQDGEQTDGQPHQSMSSTKSTHGTLRRIAAMTAPVLIGRRGSSGRGAALR
jgi:hypothetical protein